MRRASDSQLLHAFGDISNVGAAPHPPAGTFSPYSDREKVLAATLAHILQRWRLTKPSATAVFLPVTIRGEMPGRAMRGSANRRNK
ncbi:hypothetical protein EN742_22975 [Mesorhizobium sp. M4A.F.Ca.ET.020.02.1.1]|nr:hypothetical protein EN742_22975 [Mesorhizobium sp. M4A.F.Ca.ET.020.02.1.1]RWC20775.1 MAG: hypothetical protein EOS53_08160 [Mesorhizobium sp.]RWD29988.1 MAG: hypothetical protein EOS22_08040 [Mesorhizobium sp.]